jgi:Zn ribbon nucleic-acid-binding protein
MSNKSFSAGGYIAARCTRCKDNTNHTIVAMVGEKVARVECNTCGSIHNYHAEKPEKASPKRRSPSSDNKPRLTKTQREWEESLATARPDEAIAYSMTAPMAEGMLINHPNFGLGRVISISKPNKMEVRFADGVKLLRCTLG